MIKCLASILVSILFFQQSNGMPETCKDNDSVITDEIINEEISESANFLICSEPIDNLRKSKFIQNYPELKDLEIREINGNSMFNFLANKRNIDGNLFLPTKSINYYNLLLNLIQGSEKDIELAKTKIRKDFQNIFDNALYLSNEAYKAGSFYWQYDTILERYTSNYDLSEEEQEKTKIFLNSMLKESLGTKSELETLVIFLMAHEFSSYKKPYNRIFFLKGNSCFDTGVDYPQFFIYPGNTTVNIFTISIEKEKIIKNKTPYSLNKCLRHELKHMIDDIVKITPPDNFDNHKNNQFLKELLFNQDIKIDNNDYNIDVLVKILQDKETFKYFYTFERSIFFPEVLKNKYEEKITRQEIKNNFNNLIAIINLMVWEKSAEIQNILGISFIDNVIYINTMCDFYVSLYENLPIKYYHSAINENSTEEKKYMHNTFIYIPTVKAFKTLISLHSNESE